MVGPGRLQSFSESFWRDEYAVSEEDIDLVTGLILEAGRPQSLARLADAVILRRMQVEREAIARQAASGELYQPKNRYEVGQTLVFSALEMQRGEVVAVRPGNNPRYGSFGVITVRFDQNGPQREFVCAFEHDHPLNAPPEELLVGPEGERSEADLVRTFQHYVARRLEPVLEAHEEFSRFDDMWFLSELLPEVHVGHLNLAEAMIYEAGRPLTAREMVAELELPSTGSPEAQLFSLNRALSQDVRFDNVATQEQPVWFLRALVPDAVFERPEVLRPAFSAVGGEHIGLTLLDTIEEIGDELDDVDGSLTVRDLDEIRFELCFPHLYAGTLPLNRHLRRLLPDSPNRYLPLTLVDARNGKRFDVWAVPEERYVCGLGEWYAEVGMCVGGQLALIPEDTPQTFTVSFTPSRSRRSEWVYTAAVEADDLALQMQRATIRVRCDRNMLIDVPDTEAIVSLMRQAAEAQMSMSALLRTVFRELAKFNSRGLVHAKSIYSAANLLRRSGAVPLLAELTRRACYDPVGDGFWAYEPELEGSVYRTPDDMRERPLSHREDIIRDQVVQYLGR